eukprot:TRINITY_DN768_c0_g1_i1.p2 TRINITY_DN768_c0_g1~~TRINITY_DN768_c0_g1_i1.p2  ORF type:complete len:149 (+),score=17.05 TRINITY_DN768_c0_g1_i1:244-690(+)
MEEGLDAWCAHRREWNGIKVKEFRDMIGRGGKRERGILARNMQNIKQHNTRRLDDSTLITIVIGNTVDTPSAPSTTPPQRKNGTAAHARTRTHMHTHTRARTHTHTHARSHATTSRAGGSPPWHKETLWQYTCRCRTGKNIRREDQAS